MLCKICHTNESHPKYRGLCSHCRSRRYDYSKGRLCTRCGKPVANRITTCFDCNSIVRGHRVERVCGICGKTYSTPAARRLKYCSTACNEIAKTIRASGRGDKAMAWKGTNTLEKRGYITSFDFNRRRRVFIHTQIAERLLGRRLKSKEVVHHIDLDKTNNENSNLLICERWYHRWLHHQMELAWAIEHLRPNLQIDSQR